MVSGGDSLGGEGIFLGWLIDIEKLMVSGGDSLGVRGYAWPVKSVYYDHYTTTDVINSFK